MERAIIVIRLPIGILRPPVSTHSCFLLFLLLFLLGLPLESLNSPPGLFVGHRPIDLHYHLFMSMQLSEISQTVLAISAIAMALSWSCSSSHSWRLASRASFRFNRLSPCGLLGTVWYRSFLFSRPFFLLSSILLETH